MKIYILTDLEGATGIFKFAQTRGTMGTPAGIEAMRFLMRDIAAVVKGLREGGATEILVLDGHNGGNNFLPEEMVAGAKYVTGYPRPSLYGLGEDCHGMVQLGMHAMNGTQDGVLHHTQNSSAEAKYWYDGVEQGELYQGAVHAGHYNVPVIMVTGDEAACREAKKLHGDDLPTAAVKKGLSREAAVLLAPEDSMALLTKVAKQAMQDIGKRKPYKPTFPIEMRTIRMGANPNTPDTPWYTERKYLVNQGTDIVRGSVEIE